MRREDETNEFKRTTGELNEAMISISAILNKHRGGTLWFGLKNDGTAQNFTITDSTLRDISRKIFETIRPQIIPEISTDLIDGTEVIRVAFSGNDVPYSAAGRYYIRSADEDRELTPDQLRQLMLGKEYEDAWEDRVSEETAEDADEDSLLRFYRKAVDCGRMPPMEEFDKVKLLIKLGLLSGGHLTNAGRLLFSKNRPVTLKMAVFATEHKSTFLDIEREQGNLFRLIDSGTSWLYRNIRWKAVIPGDTPERQEIPEVPADALREAVINSFAHARYDLGIQHEIDIFSDRISILNPGSFANGYEPVDFVNMELHSFLRNKTIANILYLCHEVETFGSGIRRIYTSCGEHNVAVSYRNMDSAFLIEFSRQDRNTAAGSEDQKGSDSLSILEDYVYRLIRSKGHMTGAEIMKATQKSRRTISRVTAVLLGKGLIERAGSKKTGYYRAK